MYFDPHLVSREENDWELELCLHLQASLDSAFQKRQAGVLPSGDEWGEAFFRAFDELPREDRGGAETVYLVAHNTLEAQARHGLGRPLAHRILADPEAFLKSLLAAMKELDF